MSEKMLMARVGAGIRRWRKEAGLTIAELAEQAGMDVGFLSYIETGKKMPSLATIAKLASALGLTLSELLKDVSRPSTDKDYRLERQVISYLHDCSDKQKKTALMLLRDLSDPERLDALRRLMRK